MATNTPSSMYSPSISTESFELAIPLTSVSFAQLFRSLRNTSHFARSHLSQSAPLYLEHHQVSFLCEVTLPELLNMLSTIKKEKSIIYIGETNRKRKASKTLKNGGDRLQPRLPCKGGGRLRPGPLQGMAVRRGSSPQGAATYWGNSRPRARSVVARPPARGGHPLGQQPTSGQPVAGATPVGGLPATEAPSAASSQPARCCLPAASPQRGDAHRGTACGHIAGRRGDCRQARAASACTGVLAAATQKGNIGLGHPLEKRMILPL
ncbi:hypothetical protein GW17_00017994 [Ensete ventricosum]|nr:hypothetical protein GW17_00017994 [Ensete ventricosum]